MEKSNKKPQCKLIGTDGNVFALIGVVDRCLRAHGLRQASVEMQQRIWGTEDKQGAQDYNEALRIIMDYVEVE
jgi:hypothetical protein